MTAPTCLFETRWGGAFETFPPVLDESTGNITVLDSVNDFNDAGEFCGGAFVSYPKKIKGSNGEYRNYVQGSSLETFTVIDDSFLAKAYRLNESGDFIARQGGLYHRSYLESGGGALLVSDLLDPTDAGAIIWAEFVSGHLLEGISKRDDPTGFPKLFGSAEFANGDVKGFVLTPVAFP